MVLKKLFINGKSLLAAGIKKVSGKFNKGDHIKIIDIKRNEFARGLSSFSSEEIVKIIGCHSNEIEKILGYISKSEVVHKDDMVKNLMKNLLINIGKKSKKAFIHKN